MLKFGVLNVQRCNIGIRQVYPPESIKNLMRMVYLYYQDHVIVNLFQLDIQMEGNLELYHGDDCVVYMRMVIYCIC
jgi:hypothetical protein